MESGVSMTVLKVGCLLLLNMTEAQTQQNISNNLLTIVLLYTPGSFAYNAYS